MKILFELFRLKRPQQWVKNGFLFTGLLFGHAFHDGALVWQVIVAALAFSLVSSAIYIINDIADREQDRIHPKKKNRPLASGTVSIKKAVVLSVMLAIIAIALAYSVSEIVLWIIIGYGVMNLAYSFRLKHVVLLDVFIIATGFMLRILAGTSGVGIPPSQWLLLCGLMVTLFLGFAKRRAEIIALTDDKNSHRKVLEHYSPVMLDNMIGVTAAGLIMSYSLYTMSSETIRIQGTPNLVYTVPFIMYGVFRYIYLLHHQSGGGDPSRDLTRDSHILVVVGGWLAATIWLIN